MEFSTIEMSEEEAQARLMKYRALLENERTQQDQRIAAGYRVLARGNSIIKLSESITAGGYFDNGLPRLAIMRADSQDCWVRVEGPWQDRGSLIYSSVDGASWHNRGALVNATSVRVSVVMPDPVGRRSWHGHAIAPIIPPENRPKPNRLHLFHILWEVEAWDLTPPRDPALLKWIGGDLWAVEAMWDLTELERAILQR